MVLDATWSNSQHRAQARGVATEREALFAIVECTASDDALKARLSKATRTITDGRIELLDDQRAAYESPTAEEAELLIQIDTSGDFQQTVTRAFQSLFA